jgi:uncharacterized protein (TIGR02466 family)|tara:strand:- start:1984 stop:2565 length:582 start_codon:yes stop_codon:yes gene_type:complete
MKDKNINYRYFHWGPFLFKTLLEQKELDSIKKLCSKKSKSYNKNLAGLIKHEHMLDVKKIFPILLPYIKSYSKAFSNYSGKNLGQNIELKSCWVNYMTKFESNPLHSHDDDLSFVIYTKIPKQLKIEYNKCKANTKPGAINFIISLDEGWINQHTFVPEVGDFFIFPADLKHYVNHFKSNGERISISGNLKIT